MSTRHVLLFATSSLLALTLTGCASPSSKQAAKTVQATANTAQATGLTQLLTQKLGVNSQQASVGAGALFQLAQTKMGNNEFQQLTSSVPEVSSLINTVAPSKPSALAQIASGTSALIGDENDTAGAVVKAYETFKSLGLSSDMVSQFVPVMTDYVSRNAAPTITNALVSALTGL